MYSDGWTKIELHLFHLSHAFDVAIQNNGIVTGGQLLEGMKDQGTLF